MLLRTVFTSLVDKANSYTTHIPQFVSKDNDYQIPVPAHCQRDLCWSEQQYSDYIKYILCEKEAGAFIFYKIANDESSYIYTLDGQHRLEAIRRFMYDNLKVTHNGKTYSYDGFGGDDKRTFKHITGSVKMLVDDVYDKEKVELIYNTFNFTGVKHTK